jgi:hypothetical protein
MTDLVFKAPSAFVYTTALPSGTPMSIATLVSSTALAVLNSTFAASATSSATSSTPTATQPAVVQRQAFKIGIGLSVSGTAVIVLLIMWYWHWEKKKKMRASAPAPSEAVGDERKELAGEVVVEKSGDQRYEIQDKEPPTEVAGDMYRAELSAMAERDTRT